MPQASLPSHPPGAPVHAHPGRFFLWPIDPPLPSPLGVYVDNLDDRLEVEAVVLDVDD